MRPLLMITCFVWLLAGCRKADRNQDTDTTLAEDVLNAQPALYEVFLAAHEGLLSTPGIRSYTGCAGLTADTLGNPKTLIIDFGSGCNGTTGRSRSGKLIVYQHGHYAVSGSTSAVYFDSFYINGYTYGGTLGLTTTGSGYLLKPANLKIQSPGLVYSYLLNGSLALAQTAGAGTTLADDDRFTITGNMDITGRNGNTGKCTPGTASPLVLDGGCAEVVSGRLNLAPNGLAPREMDFGTGACDRQATVTLNTSTITLTLGF